MATHNNKTGFRWKNQSTFIVIGAGATLSLNDFLTFPVMAGENGGAAFLLMYAFFLLLLGLPLMMSELMLGRMTRRNIVPSLENLSKKYDASVAWKIAGALALLSGFLILSSYSVLSGWSLAYFVKTGVGVYNGVTLDGVSALFRKFQGNTEAMMLWHTLFVVLLVAISAQKLKKGLQRMLIVMVPGMVILLVVGLIYAFYSDGMQQSIEYILYPDWSRVDSATPIMALQRAFFTLALGLGIMVIFGAYADEKINIGYASLQIIIIDFLFSIMTGLAINALVFSAGVEPVVDDALAFRVLPVIFGAHEYGELFGALFYLLLLLAALTTALAILEVLVSYLSVRFRCSRLRAAAQTGLAIWLLGLGTIFSYSLWSESGFTMTLYYGEEAHRVINDARFNDVVIYLSSHIMQPFSALLVAIFVGWKIPRSDSHAALALPNRKLFELWNFGIRYVTPILVFIVLLSTLGIINS
jgi:NSS family neurotransmitter:Na+ symporter